MGILPAGNIIIAWKTTSIYQKRKPMIIYISECRTCALTLQNPYRSVYRFEGLVTCSCSGRLCIFAVSRGEALLGLLVVYNTIHRHMTASLTPPMQSYTNKT